MKYSMGSDGATKRGEASAPERVVLFDADGVLVVPNEPFSVVYSRSRGLPYEPFGNFFDTEWKDFVVGKRDFMQEVLDRPEFWQWTDAPEKLLQYWFEHENVQNKSLVSLVKQLHRGVTMRVIWRVNRSNTAPSIFARKCSRICSGGTL